jgi:hypothetical protein
MRGVFGPVKTRCEGFFTASVNGKVQTISREAAIQRQLQNLPWSSGVREIASVRASRIQQEKDRVAREAAEEAAKLQAIEDARVQAERQVQEAKAAEQRALQDKIAALKAQIAEEKAQAAQEKNWVFKQIDKLKGGATATTIQEGAKPATAVVPATPTGPKTSATPAAPPSATITVSPTSANTAPTLIETKTESAPLGAGSTNGNREVQMPLPPLPQ